MRGLFEIRKPGSGAISHGHGFDENGAYFQWLRSQSGCEFVFMGPVIFKTRWHVYMRRRSDFAMCGYKSSPAYRRWIISISKCAPDYWMRYWPAFSNSHLDEVPYTSTLWAWHVKDEQGN